jgi:hypothetical protein
MLSLRFLAITTLILAACGHSADEAKIIGVWQCNPRNGNIWRMTFTSDHKLVLALPNDKTHDVNLRDAKFDFFLSGTWRIDGTDLVYTIEDPGSETPKTTTRMKLSEFEHAAPFGTDRDAYLQRM